LSEYTANLNLGNLPSRRWQIFMLVFPSQHQHQDQPIPRIPIDKLVIALVREAHRALAHTG
jgi:hypothetical protein